MAFADKSTFIPVEALEAFGNHPAELQIDIDDYFMGTQTNSETRRAQESTEQMELSKASLEETFKEKKITYKKPKIYQRVYAHKESNQL
ncbi:unnamed protein product [Dracunculus medinensis]|uniref:Phage protein n=1 Tax=Dracunculus medinensis TaxID=318479 RepID=A0A0N4U7R1_DRAME|nr:unnamed protein product [Dracunculus medinensis]